MKIALVHDFLVQDGGAESVLRDLHAIWPEAPIYTIIHDKRGFDPTFLQKDVRSSFLQNVPFGVKKYQWMLPLMPSAVERHNLMEFDVVLSSSSAFAKGVITGPRTLHICYCHTPTRYLWTDTHSYINELSYNRVVKRALPFLLTNLRLWDQMTASRVDHFIANSQTVQERIRKYYGRESVVMHPAIDVHKHPLRRTKMPSERFFLIGGRLVSYKRYDIAIQAFNKLGIPLKIFGMGPELERLKMIAKPNIEFLGYVSDEKLQTLYGEAEAFLHPQEEDFGLTALESMAAGCPVVAYAAGGALETVVQGHTGTFFEEQTWESIADTILHFEPECFDPEAMRHHAQKFDRSFFQQRMRSYVERSWDEFERSIPKPQQVLQSHLQV